MLTKLLCLLIIYTCLGISFSLIDDDCDIVSTHPNILLLETLTGKVNGECWEIPLYYSEDESNEVEVLIWMSVPYAEPPINENRFMKTQPKKPWATIIDGTESPYSCLQTEDENTSEDCLYLNIYIQASSFLNREKVLKPILVYIHGGSYLSGDGVSYDPSNIVAMTDIIVITINYRMNALGFLHMPDTEATGNQGK